ARRKISLERSEARSVGVARSTKRDADKRHARNTTGGEIGGGRGCGRAEIREEPPHLGFGFWPWAWHSQVGIYPPSSLCPCGPPLGRQEPTPVETLLAQGAIPQHHERSGPSDVDEIDRRLAESKRGSKTGRSRR